MRKPSLGRCVGYYRVSPREPSEIRASLDAQRESVRRFVASHGGTLIKEFEEIAAGEDEKAAVCWPERPYVEPGRLDWLTECNRPVLVLALGMCRIGNQLRRNGATLIVSSTDRLARSAGFVAAAMKANLRFAVADMPRAGEFELHLAAIAAEHRMNKAEFGRRFAEALSRPSNL